MVRDPRRKRADLDPAVAVVAAAAVAAILPRMENPPIQRKWKEAPLPTDICCRCGKSQHQKGQPCKAMEAFCRSCGTKGHYKKVCMRKSTNLVEVPSSSRDSDPDYFDEFGEPVYVQTHLVHAKEIHKKKHLIQFPISVSVSKK